MYGGRQEKYADLAKRVEERLGVSTMSDQGSEEQVSLLLDTMLSPIRPHALSQNDAQVPLTGVPQLSLQGLAPKLQAFCPKP